MGGGKMFGKLRGLMFTFTCLALLGGCNESGKDASKDGGVFDTSRLPRISGAKEVFASAPTTIFTSPDSVGQTGDTLEKALAAAGWQRYVAPNTAYSNDPSMRTMSLKKGAQALSVFISVAPAQNNATSVQYGSLPLKTDLPFSNDANNIEYAPDQPSLTLITAEPVDNTLNFYRKELATRGWSLWSEKTNGKQAADGPSGVVHERGAYAYYTTDKNPSVAMVLTLQKTEAGKFKVELKQWPADILASAHRAYLNSDNFNTPLADVTKLPRLAGAKEDANRSSPEKLTYSVAGNLPATRAAVKTLLAADGWQNYTAPLEDEHPTGMLFKKGAQGLSVSFTISVGTTYETTNQTTVYYSPARFRFALAAPADATGMVYDENRPYLSIMTAGTIDATRDFFAKQLRTSGWLPLSAADAAAKWPDAKSANGTSAYFIRGDQRVIMLSLQSRDGKTDAEIKVPPFAEPQTLEAGQDTYGLPQPKLIKTAGGTGGSTRRQIYAHVPAEVGTVLAFYRRELAARDWKEETQGAVVEPEHVMLTFTSAEGTVALKLDHKYDLTIASLAQQVAQAAPKSAAGAKDDSADAITKQANQMIRDAIADAMRGSKRQKTAPSPGPQEVLRPAARNDVPVALPEGAEDVEFDGNDGKLEFSSQSSVASIAAFYRSAMKPLGWREATSVINRPNMVVLDFSKGRDAISFTIMQVGTKSNVTADGSALKTAAAKPSVANPAGAKAASVTSADAPSQPATADDLIAEESGGLPVPKRHTLALGEKTPFRRQLTANVPLDLTAVLGFYRRELGKLNWKEDSKGLVTAPGSAAIAYATPEGPALLKLGRKDGETIVHLSIKDPNAAGKAGILPKAGRTKILFGNIMPAEAAITFNNKIVKVAAGAGTKAPDGPTLDLAPGKYKYSINLAGKPVQNDEIDVGADETWGLMIGPGGVLALQAY